MHRKSFGGFKWPFKGGARLIEVAAWAGLTVLMFHKNIVKISGKNEQVELVEICFQVSYPTDFCLVLQSYLHWGKVKTFDFLKIND